MNKIWKANTKFVDPTSTKDTTCIQEYFLFILDGNVFFFSDIVSKLITTSTDTWTGQAEVNSRQVRTDTKQQNSARRNIMKTSLSKIQNGENGQQNHKG